MPISLRLLRQAVDPRISAFDHCLIKTSASPSALYRVTLDYPQGHPGVPSVILKLIAPSWPHDANGPDRETNFYTRLRPCLGLPCPEVYHIGVDPETAYRLILLEDLAGSHLFPLPTHQWTQEEARQILCAYAQLHARGHDCLPPESERAWMWRMALQERTWEPEELLRMVDALVAMGVWTPLPRIEGLVECTLDSMEAFNRYPATLIHNDVYPPNIALPLGPGEQAALLDWEMAGWGPAELDLAFMFLQPFRSAQQLERTEMLAHYWAVRQAMEYACPPVGERQDIQRQADAVWALSLVPVAHRVANRPYPAGSAPHAYWDAMFAILHESLHSLSDET